MYKLRIYSSDHFYAVQKQLLLAGFRWRSGRQKLRYQFNWFIFVMPDDTLKTMTGHTPNKFKPELLWLEITIHDLFSLDIKPGQKRVELSGQMRLRV